MLSYLKIKKQKKYRPAVFVVIYKKQGKNISYLLLKRKLHWIGWEFPKGGIEPGETPIQTVYREIKEETNLKPLKIQSHEYSGYYIYDKKTRKDSKRKKYFGQSFSLYSAMVKSGKIKIDQYEHADFKWADFKTAMEMLTWVNQKNSLKLVNASVKN